MIPPSWWLVGIGLALMSFGVRVWVHRGPPPIGLDTWYYLAYADAVRRRPGFDVRLTQYLLQDERQSYPPLFPMLLALFPASWLRRWYRMVPPLFDGAHVLMLFWVAVWATGSPAVAGLVASMLAFSPQLVAEPSSLHGRGLGALLHSAAMVLALESILRGGEQLWLGAALLAGSGVFLGSAAMSAAYGLALAILSVVLLEPRYLLIACGSAFLAAIVSGGQFLRVVRNYFQAVQYWLRNHRFFGAHPIRHSPLYGTPLSEKQPAPLDRGLLGHGRIDQLLRLIGENPGALALPLVTHQLNVGLAGLETWAVGLTVVSVLAMLVSPFRAFGLGRTYMRAAVFPTAYTLGMGIGGTRGLLTPLGIASVACLGISIMLTIVLYLRRRKQGDEKAFLAREGLEQAVHCLATQPLGGILCLPYIYSGYASYHAGKPVLWGGHCGDLSRWEALAPVIRRPIPELTKEYGVRYLLLETVYAAPGDVGLEGAVDLKGHWGGFALYECKVRHVTPTC